MPSAYPESVMHSDAQDPGVDRIGVGGQAPGGIGGEATARSVRP